MYSVQICDLTMTYSTAEKEEMLETWVGTVLELWVSEVMWIIWNLSFIVNRLPQITLMTLQNMDWRICLGNIEFTEGARSPGDAADVT